MATFKERLKELREKKNLNIMQLAENLNINHSNVSRWESGKQSPKVEYIIKLAEFFEVSAGYLLGMED